MGDTQLKPQIDEYFGKRLVNKLTALNPNWNVNYSNSKRGYIILKNKNMKPQSNIITFPREEYLPKAVISYNVPANNKVSANSKVSANNKIKSNNETTKVYKAYKKSTAPTYSISPKMGTNTVVLSPTSVGGNSDITAVCGLCCAGCAAENGLNPGSCNYTTYCQACTC